MGHRENLLAGAKQCLYERGYAHTTARDIVAASGTNLASIGYHFGSKEQLLNAALFELIEEWNTELSRALSAETAASVTSLERFERYWIHITESFVTQRPMWLATFEVFAQIERFPELERAIANGLQEGRMGWAGLIHTIDVAAEPEQARQVGSFYQALLSGVLVQWLVDPHRAPSGHDLAAALRIIAGRVQTEAND